MQPRVRIQVKGHCIYTINNLINIFTLQIRVGIGSTFQNPTRPEPDDLQPEPDPNPKIFNPNPTRTRSVYKCRYSINRVFLLYRVFLLLLRIIFDFTIFPTQIHRIFLLIGCFCLIFAIFRQLFLLLPEKISNFFSFCFFLVFLFTIGSSFCSTSLSISWIGSFKKSGFFALGVFAFFAGTSRYKNTRFIPY